MKKMVSLLVSAALLSSLLAACSQEAKPAASSSSNVAPATTEAATPAASSAESADSEQQRTVKDLSGKEVVIPKEVNRVASSFPAIEEVFLLLGSADKNVAIVESNKKNPWYLKLYPKAAELPVVFSSTTEFNLESLLKVKPDVVFVADEETRDKLIEAGIPALYVMFSSPETVIQGVKMIGEVLGGDAPQIASELVSDYEKNMAAVKAKTDAIPKEKRPTVFYAANNTLNTEAKGSIVTSWIEMAGGVNIATEKGIEGLFKDVTLETLLEWDPDIIIARDAAHKQEYMTDKRFANLSAVKNDKVFVNPRGVFVWCVRSADEVLQPIWAGTVIQPELFSDLNVEDYVTDFYDKYYHYQVTEADLQDILNPAQ